MSDGRLLIASILLILFASVHVGLSQVTTSGADEEETNITEEQNFPASSEDKGENPSRIPSMIRNSVTTEASKELTTKKRQVFFFRRKSVDQATPTASTNELNSRNFPTSTETMKIVFFSMDKVEQKHPQQYQPKSARVQKRTKLTQAWLASTLSIIVMSLLAVAILIAFLFFFVRAMREDRKKVKDEALLNPRMKRG